MMLWPMITAVVVFFVLLVVLRVTGKRELAQMSPFDLVLLYVIGDVTGESVVGEDTSFTGSLATVSVFALLTILASWASYRFPRTRQPLEGLSTIIVRDGVPDLGAMRREHVSDDDLHEAARLASIADIGDIELAVLEQNGRFSFFTRKDLRD